MDCIDHINKTGYVFLMSSLRCIRLRWAEGDVCLSGRQQGAGMNFGSGNSFDFWHNHTAVNIARERERERPMYLPVCEKRDGITEIEGKVC